MLADRAGSSRAEDCVALVQDGRLHEQVAERWLYRVCDRRREHDFRIARDLDRPAHARVIGDSNSPQLDVVFRRHDDLRIRFAVMVAAPEFRATLREHDFVRIRRLQRRLMRCGPVFSARRVTHVEKRAPIVTCAVFTPSRDRKIPPAAVAAACVGHHDVVAAIREQLDLRGRGVHSDRGLWRPFGCIDECTAFGVLGDVLVECRCLWNALLQEQQRRLEQRIRFKSPLHRAVEDLVRERQQIHSLVMSHV